MSLTKDWTELEEKLKKELVRYTLFAKETTLQHSNGEPYKVIPINKLILGEDVSNIIT